MRRSCQRVVQTKCAHAGYSFHAGRAVFAALHPRAFTTTTKCHKDEKPRATVRWFEQTGKSKDTIRPMEDDESLESLEEAEMTLSEIEKEFSRMASGVDLSRLREPTTLSPVAEDEIFDENAMDMHYQIPQLIKRHITNFNEALKRSAANPNIRNRSDLMAQYLRCSNTMPGFQEQIVDAAWKVLWQSQSALPFFTDQAHHLLKLAHDMTRIGIKLSPAQKLLRIQALEYLGEIKEAINEWHLARSVLEKDGTLRHDFASLGVYLECANEQPQQAQDIAFATIGTQKHNIGATRLLIPVIAAWARKGSEADLKRAWLLYLLVRQTLGSAQTAEDAIKMEDFDQIYLGFVDAGRKDLAVLVFKDLMVAGQQSQFDSLRMSKSYSQVLSDLHDSAKTAEQVNKTSIDLLYKLPKRFENKYFYAAWMRRLFGVGRADAALLVMELMYERGVKPDAYHINGIISNWIHTGTPDEQKKALDLGWMMIDERLKIVSQRRKPEQTISSTDPMEGLRVPVHRSRPVPAAITETLCLLLLYYKDRNMGLEVGRLQELLVATDLRPNSYFLNHTMGFYQRQGKWAEAYNVYSNTFRGVRPDMVTFTCLWDCAHIVIQRYEQTDKFPSPRRLFSTMMNWYAQLHPRAKAKALESFTTDLFARVVQVFMQHKDTKGMLVALYAMRDSFGVYPDDDTIRAVSVQLAHIGEPRQAGHPIGRSRTRRRKAPTVNINRNIEKATQVLGMIWENRVVEIAEQGTEMGKLDAQQQAEERLYLLAEGLRAADRQLLAARADPEESTALSEDVDKVAWEMGVGPFKLGPPVYNRQ